jgi:hypothetical protein
MKKTREQIIKEVEETMLKLHNKIYKFRLYDEHRGTRTVEYTKGKFEIEVQMNIQEIREQRLLELGI